MRETAIILDGDFGKSGLAKSLMKSFRFANLGPSRLPRWVLNLEGMSGRRYRRLVNNLVSRVADPVYLEVGSWMGSTVCAALWNNPATAVCIDNWSEFGGPRDAFMKNLSRVKGDSSVSVLEEDFRLVQWGQIFPKANIYLFDGPHFEMDQFDGIALALPALEDEFILIVDDFNWDYVREGTFRAMSEKNLAVVASITIRTNASGREPKVWMEKSDWHNGYFIAVLAKEGSGLKR